MGAAADLSVSKSLASPASPVFGDTLVYVITTSNAGPSAVSDAAVADTLPTGATFVSATNSGAASSGVVTWPAFFLASGASRVDTVRVSASSEGAYRNVVVVSSSADDPDGGDVFRGPPGPG